MTTALADRPHALYRFYNRKGHLLYIGITAALPNRLHTHRDDKPWWTDVARVDITHYPDRESVLAAEQKAIAAERPKWNVVHNRPPSLPASRQGPPRTRGHIPDGCKPWTFTGRGGHTRTGPLWLVWEATGDPISDDWSPDDISAEELWRLWLTRFGQDTECEAKYGPGTISIDWFVTGAGTMEAAPFQQLDWNPRHFLTQFTWPVHAKTGDRLQWSRLPIEEKVWRRNNIPELHTYKGGFIQEATGWRPAPFQPYMNVVQLALMSGLYVPEVNFGAVPAA